MLEGDEAKRRRTLHARGIDFADVLAVFDDPRRLEVGEVRSDYGERRFVILCPLRGRLVHVTCTRRGSSRRIISARKANRREQRIHERYRDDRGGDSHH
jgi:uncharacterized protein